MQGTIGGVHHVASVVPDAEAAARFQEDVLGRILGADDVTGFRTIMLAAPGAHRAAQVEFVELMTRRGPGHVVMPGLHVTSYRVRSVPDSWADLIGAGAEGVQRPC